MPDSGSNPPPPPPDMAPPPDEPPQVCSPADPNSCSGETICIGTTCEDAFNRIYSFSTVTVKVASLNQGGSAWDVLGGAPDPQVVVKLNDATILTTAVKSDVFSASFTESVDQQIVAGSKLELTSQDSDVGAADKILDCVANPLSAELLRAHAIQCDGNGTEAGSQITIHIDAKGG
jgi:hypothetical protein